MSTRTTHRSARVWKLFPNMKTPRRAQILSSLLHSAEQKTSKAGNIVLSLDYDGCTDILQTSGKVEVYEPVFSEKGFAGPLKSHKAHVIWAHYLLRGIIEDVSARHKRTILINGSLDQSRSRTREFAKLAAAYKLEFNATRYEGKSNSHAAFKKATHLHQRKVFNKRTRFLFLDDLKTNVNAVASAGTNTTCAQFDYFPLCSGRVGIKRFTENILTQLKGVLSASFVKRALRTASEFATLAHV